MKLPHPFHTDEWPQPILLLVWAALAGAALVAIMAGLGVVTTVVSTQGPLLYAFAGGWLLAAIANVPIDWLVARGWSRGRAALVVWIAGAVPIIVIAIELAIAFAQSLGGIIVGPEPTTAEVAAMVERLSNLLSSIGLTINLVPTATDIVLAIRHAAESIQSNIAPIAAGALSVLGPLVLAIEVGIILSVRPNHLDSLSKIKTTGRLRQVRRSRKILEDLVARFITRHFVLGFVYGAIVYVGATIAGVDGLLAAVLGGLVMAIPSIGQGLAVVPPLLLAILTAGPNILPGSIVIVVGWLFCLTQLAPRLLDGVLRLPSTTVFIAGSVGGLLAGVPGAVFALPLVAAVVAIRREGAPVATKVSRTPRSRRAS